MKEITRRLYTKPIMLGFAFLVAAVLVAGLFVTTNSRAAATIFIPAGNDEFETTGDGQTYHNFAASKVPANFFGPGSNEFKEVVPLVGVPLAPAVSDVDTIIQRNQNVTLPGSPTTSLTMTGFSLKSINPINVTYTGGASEAWNVQVGLSLFKASTGSMTISAGGTFDSSLKVWPRFTFKRVSDNRTLVLDTGDPNGPALTAADATAIGSDIEPAPAPEPAPTIAPAPCVAVIDDFEGRTISGGSMISAASTSTCAPVTLTSSGSPWTPNCPSGFCIPRPISEWELLASHFASPKGTKKAIAAKTAGTAVQ